MPQIGWLEILAVVIIAILVLGPKEFPIALKKIGSFIGKLKTTLQMISISMLLISAEMGRLFFDISITMLWSSAFFSILSL